SLGQDRSRDRRDGRDSDRGPRRDRDDNRRSDERTRKDDRRIEFTHSREGRRLDNGVVLRRGTVYTDRHFDRFFPHHYYSYPHYAGPGVSVDVVLSPFHFYYGTFPPYISRSHVFVAPPTLVYIDVPIYVGGAYHGYDDRRDDYYLSRRRDDDRWRNEPGLRRAVYDLEDGFRDEDITLLSQITDPGAKIAVFARGHFEYSVDANDYLD